MVIVMLVQLPCSDLSRDKHDQPVAHDILGCWISMVRIMMRTALKNMMLLMKFDNINPSPDLSGVQYQNMIIANSDLPGIKHNQPTALPRLHSLPPRRGRPQHDREDTQVTKT